MASSAERAIRDDLVAWWHENYPKARVIHELPLSSFSAAGRADLGVISPTEIILVEIKSEKDRLDKLEAQYRAMSRRAHWFQCVLHDKWFERGKFGPRAVNGQDWLEDYMVWRHCWSWPSRDAGWGNRWGGYPDETLPASYDLLHFLHAAELDRAYSIYSADVAKRKRRMSREQMVRQLTGALTGDQVRRTVCRALRARQFAEADPAICDEPEPKQPDLLEVANG